MQSFQFRLQRILSWRRTALAAEEIRLGGLMAEQKCLEAAAQKIVAAGERAGRELLADGTVDGGSLSALSAYRARLEREHTANERQRAETREKIAQQRARMVEAQRRVRLLEKLRSRRMEEWRAVADREMESFASEAFLARWRYARTKRTAPA